MNCKNCGKKLKKREKFCSQCGSCVLDNKSTGRKVRFVKIGILAVMMLVGICGSAIWWQNHNGSNNLTSENKETEGVNGSEQFEYLAVVENKDNKMGFITKDGEEVVACKYDYAKDFEDGVAKVGIENGVDEEGETRYLYGLINSQGEEIVQCRYDGISIYDDEHLIQVEWDGKDGLLDENGNWIVSCRYDYILYPLPETDLLLVSQDGKRGCINSKGEEIIPFTYDEIYTVNNTENKILIMVQKGRWSHENPRWGIMNEKGQEIIPLQENYFGTYIEGGLIKIEQDGKYGFVNYNGELVIPVEYDFAGDFGKNRLAVVGKNGDSFIIDESGATVSECQNAYMLAKAFEGNGLACVYSESGYGWVNEYGEEIIPCRYDSVEYDLVVRGTFDSNGLARVEKNGKYGFINEEGMEIIPCEYDSLRGLHCGLFFDNGLIAAEQDGKIGCLNEEGEIVVPFIYDGITGPDYEHRYYDTSGLQVMNFSPNMIVYVNGKYGILNENGEEIIPCIYERFDAADEKGFFVAYKGKSPQGESENPVLLNLSGEVVVPEQYEYIGGFGDDDLAPVSDGERCSYVDREGTVVKVLPDKYKKSGKFVKVQ